MNRQVLEEKVFYYTNIIEDPKKLIEAIENVDSSIWGEWAACSGEHYIYGTDRTISSSESQGIKDENNDYIYNTLKNAFDAVAKDYAEAQGITEEPKLFPVFPIKKYKAGTYMGAHFDQQEGDDRLKVSFVFYLNDDYKGGEISFTIRSPEGPIFESTPNHDFEVAKDQGLYSFYVKPEAGSMLVFPPSPPYHHTAHLVKSDFKYMVPQHWIH